MTNAIGSMKPFSVSILIVEICNLFSCFPVERCISIARWSNLTFQISLILPNKGILDESESPFSKINSEKGKTGKTGKKGLIMIITETPF